MVLLFAISLALTPVQNFPETLDNRWAFATVREFMRCGLWPTPVTFANRPPTRYELAVSIHANLRSMVKGLEHIGAKAEEEAKPSFYVPRDVAFVRLDRLMKSFGKEYTSMEVRTSDLTSMLRDARRTATLLRTRYPRMEIGSNPKWVPDIPENHRWYDLIEDLKKVGVLSAKEIPDMRGSRPLSGPEFARIASLAIPRMENFVKSNAGKDRSLDFVFTVADMADYFAPELEAAKVNMDKLWRQASLAMTALNQRRSRGG